MKKLFVSIPMKGRSEEEIRKSIAKMKNIVEAYEGEEVELIDSYVKDNPPENNNQALWYLGESIKKLSEADIMVTIDDRYYWNGCAVEYEVACRYGIKVYTIPEEVVIDNYSELINKVFNDVPGCQAKRCNL